MNGLTVNKKFKQNKIFMKSCNMFDGENKAGNRDRECWGWGGPLEKAPHLNVVLLLVSNTGIAVTHSAYIQVMSASIIKE